MIPCIILGLGSILAYYLSGLYGVAMSAMGMLSFVSLTFSVDTYGPISDNAGAIGSGGLAVLSLMLSYMYSIPGEKLTGGVHREHRGEKHRLHGLHRLDF